MVDFPFDEIDADRKAGQMSARDLVLHAFRELTYWIHQDGDGQPRGVMIRCYVIAQCVYPEMFGDITDNELCTHIEVKKQSFNQEKMKFRRKFNFVNRYMRSDRAVRAMQVSYEQRRPDAKTQ